jgi:hypothetical protein
VYIFFVAVHLACSKLFLMNACFPGEADFPPWSLTLFLECVLLSFRGIEKLPGRKVDPSSGIDWTLKKKQRICLVQNTKN